MINMPTIAIIATMSLTPVNTFTLVIKDAESAVAAVKILSDANYGYYLNNDDRFIHLKDCGDVLLLLEPLKLTNVSIVSKFTKNADINLKCTIKYRNTKATFDLLKI